MFALWFVLGFAGLVLAQNALPESFTRCRRDEQLNSCLKSAVPAALKLMKTGVPSLSVPALEPLRLAALAVQAGAGPVVIRQEYRDIRLHGLTDSQLLTYKADLNHYRLRTDSLTPKMEFIADYVMKGRILLLPIQGKGVANITLTNLLVKHDLIGEPVVRDGETYMHIREYRTRFVPKQVTLHFTDLFNGDKVLGDNMNMFLNANSELVFNELKESYEAGLSDLFKNVTNNIFDKVPMNQIFIGN
ncbi:protein takeout-like [Aricia agestis]|uniref:protein takeout-like n=1 Tax=Aricia agestis TaxID=91739 RepID=UPI001C205BAA|nr:protein takeout-like [Aricia agestis]